MEESITQVTEKNVVNNLEDLVRVWNQWDSDTRGIFTERYGDIAHLITINIDERLIQAMIRFWDLAYQCFTFNQEDMTPTIEEYAALLRVDNAEKQIKKKNEVICIPWFSLRDLVLSHPDMLKRVDLFTLAIYGLVVFPKVLGHIEKVERTPYHMFSKTFALLEAYLEREWPRDVTKEHWVSVFQNLRAKNVTWRAPWIRPSFLLYKVGNQDWVPLLGLWGGIGYASLMGPRYRKVLKENSSHRISSNFFSEEVPSELEMARQEFEREKAKMSRDLNALQEETTN
ncbi:hypothetical protein CXB51_018620 [Gossypium anomalum]|uniref:DUF7745 domain-containing protein n=1 Tax=Gossypium anomalum TaxID=47600 RepID=A0A8J5Z3Q2_9ROSI|nr:hypothetical protein CXB51_018620 [Gossypium anomalum]